MNLNDFLADNLPRTAEMLKLTLADFTDAELFVRPTASANHAAWMVGHLISSETTMFGVSGAKMPELPAGFADRFSAKNTGIDDPEAFGVSKGQLLELFARTRGATITFARGVPAGDLEKPAFERVRTFAPTVAHLLGMAGNHTLMHVGQIQVIRRKLNKPFLF